MSRVEWVANSLKPLRTRTFTVPDPLPGTGTENGILRLDLDDRRLRVLALGQSIRRQGGGLALASVFGGFRERFRVVDGGEGDDGIPVLTLSVDGMKRFSAASRSSGRIATVLEFLGADASGTRSSAELFGLIEAGALVVEPAPSRETKIRMKPLRVRVALGCGPGRRAAVRDIAPVREFAREPLVLAPGDYEIIVWASVGVFAFTSIPNTAFRTDTTALANLDLESRDDGIKARID